MSDSSRVLTLKEMKIKIFSDGADIDSIIDTYQ